MVARGFVFYILVASRVAWEVGRGRGGYCSFAWYHTLSENVISGGGSSISLGITRLCRFDCACLLLGVICGSVDPSPSHVSPAWWAALKCMISLPVGVAVF